MRHIIDYSSERELIGSRLADTAEPDWEEHGDWPILKEICGRYDIGDGLSASEQLSKTLDKSIFENKTQIQKRFEKYLKLLKIEIGGSAITQITTRSKYYRKIIGLSIEVVPLILEDLSKTGFPWFDALEALVPEEQQPERLKDGLMYEDLYEIWLEWGRNY